MNKIILGRYTKCAERVKIYYVNELKAIVGGINFIAGFGINKKISCYVQNLELGAESAKNHRFLYKFLGWVQIYQFSN